MQTIVSLTEFKSQKLTLAVQRITSGLSQADLDILHNDVLVPPIRRSILPDALQESFDEWLDDAYGAIEREEKMAPENQHETERQFLEESLESDDEAIAAQAKMLLARGQLGPIALDAVDGLEEAMPDAPLD